MLPDDGFHKPLFDAFLQPTGDAEDKIPSYPLDESGAAAKQRRWEHRVVGRLLKQFGLLSLSPTMCDMARERCGLRRLTVEAFLHFAPDFPVWLVARKLDNLHRMPLETFSRKGFLKSKIYKAYRLAEEDSADVHLAEGKGGRLALVFEWLHFEPALVVHNYYHAVEGGECVFRVDAPNGERLALQPLDVFLSSLPWSPASGDAP